MEKYKMEEQNNSNFESAGVESQVDTEQVSIEEAQPAAETQTNEHKEKKPFPKLPVIIGAAVAGIALITVLLILLLGGNKNVDIAIKENAMPQSIFVLGEEIDLSAGVLLVDQNGTVTEIPMNAAGVTVSGYDKNTLGKQTVTVTYKDKSVAFDVNVIERMQVSDHVADYLVGDALDLSSGRIKITRNDGSNYTVMLKSDKVSVIGFDSATAGQKTVTVKYTSGEETYTTSLSLNVHSVENVVLTRPTKVTYNSHDSGVEVAGGILTLSALDGKIKKEVAVTADMIEGFDLAAANKTNSPLTQTVSVMYGGTAYTYDIRITYTSVSEFKDNAYVVADLDWSKEEAPEISKLQGDTALAMMELYLDMSPAEQTLLTKEETLNMARTAIVYGFDLWGNDVLLFDGAFGVEYGEFVLYAESAEAIANAIELLADTDRPLFTLYDVIYGIVSTFGTEANDETVYEGVSFSDYPTFDPELFEELADVFAYMLELDDLMDAVGADWKENIEQYANEIEAVYDSMINGDYYSYDYAQFFIYVSLWRENDDAFDFLYHYYFDVLRDTDSVIMIANLRLPSKLEEIFVYVYEAMTQLEYISNYYTADTTQFLYNYFTAIDLSNKLILSEDPADSMVQVLFYGLPLNSMLGMSAENGLYTFVDMIDYLCTVEGGYYSICGALLGNPDFEALLDQYLYILTTIFEHYEEDEFGNVTNDYEYSAEYVNDVKDMLALYLQLTPSQQFFFNGALNAFYGQNIPPYVFDTTSEFADFIALFFTMVNDVYMDMFETDAGKDAYLALMLSVESYAQRYNSDTWLEEMTNCLNYIKNALAGTEMSDADKAIFQLELGDIYAQYSALLPSDDSGDNAPAEPDLGEWADDFAALKQAVDYLEIGYYMIDSGRPMYNIFFSAFERAQKIYNYIYANADEDIKNILLNAELYPTGTLGSEPNEDTVYWCYDYVFAVYRSIYTNALLTLAGGSSIFEIYQETLAEFMEKSYDLYWSGNKELVFEIMADFRNLDVDAQIMFLFYFNQDDEFYYYAAITSACEDIGYPEYVHDTIMDLLNLEMAALIYNYYYTFYEAGEMTDEELAEAVDYLNQAYASFEYSYQFVTAEEDALFLADFGDMYEFYKNFVETVNGTVEA